MKSKISIIAVLSALVLAGIAQAQQAAVPLASLSERNVRDPKTLLPSLNTPLALGIATTSAGGTEHTLAPFTTVRLDASALGYPIVTNTIVAPTVAGQWVVLVNVGASNSIIIAEGTTVDSGGDKTLGPEDVMLLFSTGTAAYSAIYHDN